MRNGGGRLVTPTTLANEYSKNSWFKTGYESGFKQLPFVADIPSQRDALAYERGRAFAAWSLGQKHPRAVWRKGVLAKTAIERLIKAVEHRAII